MRRAYLILARRRPPPRRGADRTDEVSVRRFSCLGLGLGKPTCTPNHAWRDLCGQMWVRVFCGQKGGRGVAAFSAVQPPAGLYVRCWMIGEVCLPFRPSHCGRGRAGAIPCWFSCAVTSSRVQFTFGFFFSPCASVAGAPRSETQKCMHEHDGERQTFFYRCSIEFSSVLYTFLFVCYCVSSRYVN